MDMISHLRAQTEDAHEWALRLCSDIPGEKWDHIPQNLDTNITWQIGHLMLSYYFHTVLVIRGHQPDLLGKLPMKEYSELFTTAPPAKSVGKVRKADLLPQLRAVQEKSLEIIGSLSEKELGDALEKTGINHPIAKTKYEAINWNIKHTLWHCGQLAILRRILDSRYDFILRPE